MVEEARNFSLQRQGKTNASLSPKEASSLDIETDALSLLQNATEHLALSLRAYHRVLRVSRTIGDLEKAKKITSAHVAEAI